MEMVLTPDFDECCGIVKPKLVEQMSSAGVRSEKLFKAHFSELNKKENSIKLSATKVENATSARLSQPGVHKYTERPVQKRENQ